MEYYKVNPDNMIVRDHLALDRTILANERTFLAYLRTAVGFAAGGITLLKVFDSFWWQLSGWTAVGASLFIIILGIIRANKMKRILCTIRENNEEASNSNN
ncbi:MAG: DUF202 domain-containing protein [Lentisphaerae bacterium]|nr:DUF202 domain-containing protein [Lentisphaerota bacterium]MCP4102083.1 DUF202 domain-containing protein [Lentisphaerota bacterium]